VGLALEHRQAVVVRADAAGEDGVAVVEQVVRGDGGGGEPAGVAHILRGLFRRHVFHDDLQLGEVAAQRNELLVDEDGFAVEQVDFGGGDLAVHQQQHASTLHGLKRLVCLAQVGHAGIAVGGRAGRVELQGHHAGLLRARDLVGRQVVGEVERHQRLETHAGGHGGADAVAIGHGLRRGGHRRLEVGHDDGAAELGCGVRHHRAQRVAIAHVQVPVVGAGEGQGVGEGGGRGIHASIVANCQRILRAPCRWGTSRSPSAGN
jgi:hypothetical protein